MYSLLTHGSPGHNGSTASTVDIPTYHAGYTTCIEFQSRVVCEDDYCAAASLQHSRT